jgi:glyoxylase-like metal-dependent hydrolase (beta-lactamase superfamily II)
MVTFKHRFKSALATLCLGVALVSGAAQAQESPLTLKVITVSEASLYSNATLIMGKTDAVLVDPPFTRADGYRLVADILESGKTLKYVFVTHDHPDHFMSLEVILDAFPNAQAIAAPQVVADIWRSWPNKLKRWGPMLGANGPQRPTTPTAWEKPSFELEGQELRILGPMQGDHHDATALYIPSLNALIAGDIAFDNIHPWLGEHNAKNRKAWIKALDTLIAMKPAIVVAGHKLPGQPDDAGSLQFTRDYIVAFDAAAKKSKTSEELANKMKAAFPKAQDVLGGFILTNSAKVGVGETPPWDE